MQKPLKMTQLKENEKFWDGAVKKDSWINELKKTEINKNPSPNKSAHLKVQTERKNNSSMRELAQKENLGRQSNSDHVFVQQYL